MTDWNKHFEAATVAFSPDSLQKRLLSAVLRGDMRLLAIYGYSLNIPNSRVPESVLDTLIRQNDYRLVRGTSDRIVGTAHAAFNIYVRHFAEAYNDILFCNFRQEAARGLTDVREILDAQDWIGIGADLRSKIAKDKEHLEFITSFRRKISG